MSLSPAVWTVAYSRCLHGRRWGTASRCVLLDSPVVPREAIDEARRIARDYDLHLEILPVTVMDDERFTKNPAERCYWCKKNSVAVLKRRAQDLGITCVADGINVSDTGKHGRGLPRAPRRGSSTHSSTPV